MALSPKVIYECICCRSLRSPKTTVRTVAQPERPLVRDDLYEPEVEGVGISYKRHAYDGKLLHALMRRTCIPTIRNSPNG